MSADGDVNAAWMSEIPMASFAASLEETSI
jgi:hypothetical protein